MMFATAFALVFAASAAANPVAPGVDGADSGSGDTDFACSDDELALRCDELATSSSCASDVVDIDSNQTMGQHCPCACDLLQPQSTSDTIAATNLASTFAATTVAAGAGDDSSSSGSDGDGTAKTYALVGFSVFLVLGAGVLLGAFRTQVIRRRELLSPTHT